MEYKYEEVSLEEFNDYLDNLRHEIKLAIPDFCVDGIVLQNKIYYFIKRHNFDGGKNKKYPITIHQWTFGYLDHASDGIRAFLLNKKPIDISDIKKNKLIIGLS